jgi:hypothetical protein
MWLQFQIGWQFPVLELHADFSETPEH